MLLDSSMRGIFCIFIFAVSIVLAPLFVHAQYTPTSPMQPPMPPQDTGTGTGNDTAYEEEEPAPPPPPPVEEDEPAETDDTEIIPRPSIFPNLRLPSDTGNATSPASPRSPTAPTPPTPPEGEETDTAPTGTAGGTGEEGPEIPPIKMTFDAVVTMDYVFFNSNDTFKIKYHINMTGDINQPVGVIKTSATTVAEPSGYYAKWATGQCVLAVSIASVPCEIRYRRLSDKEIELGVVFERSIMEDWESMCTFLDAPGRKFNTRGNPEKWFDSAMAKSRPSFKKINVPISATDNTSTRFTIPKFSAPDENIGTAEIEGLGIITLQPEGAEGEAPSIEGATSSLKRKAPLTAGAAVTTNIKTPVAVTPSATVPAIPDAPLSKPVPPMATRK